MRLCSVLIEHTRSMNIKLFGCEIISTKLVMFNLTVEWRFSNLGLNLDEEWRTGKLNSKFALLTASPLPGGKSWSVLSYLSLWPSVARSSWSFFCSPPGKSNSQIPHGPNAQKDPERVRQPPPVPCICSGDCSGVIFKESHLCT